MFGPKRLDALEKRIADLEFENQLTREYLERYEGVKVVVHPAVPAVPERTELVKAKKR